MFPLLVLLGAQIGTGMVLNRQVFDEDVENPKILGVNAYVASGVIGTVLMFLGGPLGIAGAAVLGAVVNNYDARKRVMDGVKSVVKEAVDKSLADRGIVVEPTGRRQIPADTPSFIDYAASTPGGLSELFALPG